MNRYNLITGEIPVQVIQEPELETWPDQFIVNHSYYPCRVLSFTQNRNVEIARSIYRREFLSPSRNIDNSVRLQINLDIIRVLIEEIRITTKIEIKISENPRKINMVITDCRWDNDIMIFSGPHIHQL